MSRRTRTKSGQQRELLRQINQADSDEKIYDIIGVNESYKIIDLERAFRKLSLQIHPDKNKDSDKPDAEKAIKRVGNALDKLKKKIERKTARKSTRKDASSENSAGETKEKAAKEKAAREKAAREKAAREKAAREKAAREEAARAREEAARAREEAARARAREKAERARARAHRSTSDIRVSEAFKRELTQMVMSRWLSDYDDPAMRALGQTILTAIFQSDLDSVWLQISRLGLMGLFIYLKATEK